MSIAASNHSSISTGRISPVEKIIDIAELKAYPRNSEDKTSTIITFLLTTDVGYCSRKSMMLKKYSDESRKSRHISFLFRKSYTTRKNLTIDSPSPGNNFEFRLSAVSDDLIASRVPAAVTESFV